MKFTKPMVPITSDEIPKGENWVHQVKWDGIRAITHIDNNDLKLFTKTGNERSTFYPELIELVRLSKAKQVILDGEVIVLDKYGKPSLNKSLRRVKVSSKEKLSYYTREYPVKYIVFDILYKDGKELTKLPLNKRKEILNNTLNKSENITVTDDFKDGDELFRLMKDKNWEGIVSKKIDSQYISGKKHKSWLKTKIAKKMLTVICGVKLKNDFPKSLILGIYDRNTLRYIGNVSSGLKSKDRVLLKNNLSLLRVKDSPFLDYDNINTIWLKPILTCWAGYMELTDNGHLRHPKLIGFSSEQPSTANGEELVE